MLNEQTNRKLPNEYRQNMIQIRFPEPLHGGKVSEFYRIRLRRDDKIEGGEDESFRAELFQPEQVNQRFCPRCHQRMKRQDEWHMSCRQDDCKNFGKLVSVKPKRGVIRILVPRINPFNNSQNTHRIDGVKFCDSIVLVLDRRYGRPVLDSVYRTAGLLADMIGIRIL